MLVEFGLARPIVRLGRGWPWLRGPLGVVALWRRRCGHLLLRLALRRRGWCGELGPLRLRLLLDRPRLWLRLRLGPRRGLILAAAEPDIGEAAEQAHRPAILLGL